MERFQYTKKPWLSRNLALSVLIFVLFAAAFFYGVGSVSATTDRTELETLTRAIQRNVVLCYAVEGSYPESLAYLKEHYALRYNEDKYFVAYEPQGENIMPVITIKEKVQKE